MTQVTMAVLALSSLPLILIAPPVSSRTWSVLADGSGDALTVQAGLDSATSGDLVLVGPGTYYETLNLLGKAIELRSSSGPEATILDGSHGDNSVITCNSGETNASLISGFTITGGAGYEWALNSRIGGALHLQNSCPRIEGNIIRSNMALGVFGWDSRGGAISFGGPTPCNVLIRGNLFKGNMARTNGGAISVGGPCTIENNVFQDNWTLTGDGGAIFDINADQDVVIASNLFLGNEAGDHGGALYIDRSRGTTASGVQVFKNVIIGNAALGVPGTPTPSGGAVYLGKAGAVLQHNTIAFNSGTAAHADVAGGVCLDATYPDVLIENNLIYHNDEGAIRTYGVARGVVRRNLIFDNGQPDIDVSQSPGVLVEENVFSDPLFCVIGVDSRGELAWQSPALNSLYGILGAVEEGSCGPQSNTPITWGRLKSYFR